MMFIPRKIHLIWFGKNQYSSIIEKCIESWKTFCPDYEIKIWNEDNFDININEFVREAYESKKWAFVSDYVRVYALYNEGGVYIDSDCELIKGIDEILDDQHAVTGYASSNWLQSGFMASERGNEWIKMIMNYYENRHFILEDGRYDMKVNNAIITELCMNNCDFKLGDSYINMGMVKVYPRIYFQPYAKRTINWNKADINDVKKYYKYDKEKTVCIHYGTGSWVKNRNSGLFKLKHLVRMIFPSFIIEKLEKIYYKHHDWSSVK